MPHKPDNSPYTVQQVCEWFWDIEQRLDLLAQEEGGVHFWRLLRMPLYYALTEKQQLFGKPHPNAPRTSGTRLHEALRFLMYVLLRNPSFSRRKARYVVMPHPRDIGGGDIYTAALRDTLPTNDTLLLYHHMTGGHLSNSKNMAGAMLYHRLRSRLCGRKSPLSPATRTLLTEVEAQMEQTFGVCLSLEQMTLRHLRYFRIAQRFYTRLFQRCGAEKLYVVVGYMKLHLAAIDAAHRCNMEVIELQHGTFTPYHLGYSFPHAHAPVPYSPDMLLCFGQFWPQNTVLPPQTRTHIIGAPYIQSLAGKTAAIAKTPDSIVFTSQGVIGADLLHFAVTVAGKLPHKHIIFRLHPSENLPEYEALAQALTPPSNFTLSHRTPNIFALLAATQIQAGVFSTTLFEGMALGCKTIVVDMAGVEYMTPVIKKGDALLVRTPEEFCKHVEQAPLCKDAEYYYAPPVSSFVFD